LEHEASGVSFTLTAATRVIRLDRCYNPAKEKQVMAVPSRKRKGQCGPRAANVKGNNFLAR